MEGAVTGHVSVHCSFSAPMPCLARPGAWLPRQEPGPPAWEECRPHAPGWTVGVRPAATRSGLQVPSGRALPPGGAPWRPDLRPRSRAVSQLAWDHSVEPERGFYMSSSGSDLQTRLFLKQPRVTRSRQVSWPDGQAEQRCLGPPSCGRTSIGAWPGQAMRGSGTGPLGRTEAPDRRGGT